jgi:hypothetical protein
MNPNLDAKSVDWNQLVPQIESFDQFISNAFKNKDKNTLSALGAPIFGNGRGTSSNPI